MTVMLQWVVFIIDAVVYSTSAAVYIACLIVRSGTDPMLLLTLFFLLGRPLHKSLKTSSAAI